MGFQAYHMSCLQNSTSLQLIILSKKLDVIDWFLKKQIKLMATEAGLSVNKMSKDQLMPLASVTHFQIFVFEFKIFNFEN